MGVAGWVVFKGKAMVDVETDQKNKCWLPWMSPEGATFVLVLLGAVLIALGFIASSAYYNAMGFPLGLFPQESPLLQIFGFLYGVPAILIGAFYPAIGLVGWKSGESLFTGVKKRKILQCLNFVIALIAGLLIVINSLKWLDISHRVVFLLSIAAVFSSGALMANTPPVKPGVGSWLLTLGVVVVVLASVTSVMQGTSKIAYYYGELEVKKIREEKPPFSTVIRVDGECDKPGKLIICSDRFCGFHNGLNPKIVSLDGIKEIVP